MDIKNHGIHGEHKAEEKNAGEKEEEEKDILLIRRNWVAIYVGDIFCFSFLLFLSPFLSSLFR